MVAVPTLAQAMGEVPVLAPCQVKAAAWEDLPCPVAVEALEAHDPPCPVAVEASAVHDPPCLAEVEEVEYHLPLHQVMEVVEGSLQTCQAVEVVSERLLLPPFRVGAAALV